MKKRLLEFIRCPDCNGNLKLDTDTSNVSEADFFRKTGLRPEDVKGKTVFDIGCEMGRFMDVVEKWGAEVIGIDLSYVEDSAYIR